VNNYCRRKKPIPASKKRSDGGQENVHRKTKTGRQRLACISTGLLIGFLAFLFWLFAKIIGKCSQVSNEQR
jgi:hypothetical protein